MTIPRRAARHTVCIVQRRLTHYRLPVFEALRSSLSEQDVHLRLLAGTGTAAEESKNDAGHLPWAEQLHTRYFAGERLCWQPVRRYVRDVDLVVITQENKLIENHLLMLAPRRFKLAFWGHGANLQSSHQDGLKERFKRWTTNQVDWWFAYTQMSSDLVTAAGFPQERTTILNNTVDTTELLTQWQSVTAAEVEALRRSLGFGSGPVGIYIGSLYADKRLDFLFDAAEAIRARVPDFHLLLVGEGPERDKVQTWCATHTWARWVGSRFGREKVLHMAMAQITLNPGLVGLGILDSFVCATPILTTDCRIHSPEISYLESGVNGLMTVNDLHRYADACVHVLQDSAELERLRAGCARSAKDYTVRNMAQRFADGISQCLTAPRYERKGA